jgi:hypothetical protein
MASHDATHLRKDEDMPKYLMLIVEDQSAYADPSPSTMNDVMQQHGDFAAAVDAAGAKVLGGEALQPTSTATYLRGTRSGSVTVVDNPAPDLKEVLGGYYLIEAESLDEAATWAAKIPTARYGVVEVRPVVMREAEVGA